MSDKEIKQLLEQTLIDGDDSPSIHKIRLIIVNNTKEYENLVYNFYKDNNDGISLALIGSCYQHGYGVTLDFAKAKFYFELAAGKDNSYGFNNLGVLYYFGLGVTLDYAKAKFYYEKAVEKDNSYGFNNLGVLYQRGHGVTKDYVKAKFYYEKAAEKNNPYGYYNLGCAYEEEENYDKMAINYMKAYRLDNNLAISRINESPWILNLGEALLKVEDLETRIKIRDKFALQQASVGKFDTIRALVQQYL